ncbi:hypothetical protein [Paenisporosarcina antarctica]|uniref:hypothetical protein n=1 Tax=Paenisporosarcina antarctica TaxID=417367 RepID=UPI0014170411|nr:hypothetical protein [Paenisporosarcina antarctica]
MEKNRNLPFYITEKTIPRMAQRYAVDGSLKSHTYSITTFPSIRTNLKVSFTCIVTCHHIQSSKSIKGGLIWKYQIQKTLQ